MGKQRNTTIIICEGPTEFYYLNSLKDEFRILQHIKPDSPKNTFVIDDNADIIVARWNEHFNR